MLRCPRRVQRRSKSPWIKSILGRPLNAGGNPDSYDVVQFGFQYHEKYGSPEIDHDGKENSSTGIKVAKAALSPDKLKVRLTLQGWKTGFVTMVRCLDVVNDGGQRLRHDTFWYTLNQLPGN